MSTGNDGRMRARDIDRVHACGVLDAAYAEGQLGGEEYRERTAKASAAKTLGELARLTSDLQVPAAARDLTPRGVSRKPLRRGRSRAGYAGHTRARNVDRANTVRALDSALGDGQLSAEEHEAATELASEAKTLAELAELVADLQRAAAPSPTPPRSRRRLLFRVAVGVTAVLGVWAGYVAAGRDDAGVTATSRQTLDPNPVQPLVLPTPELDTVAGMTLFRDRYREKFGDTIVDELALHQNFASVQRVAPEGPRWSVDWDYWGGFERRHDTVTTRDPDTRTVDLAVLDVAAIGKVLADAPRLTKVPDGVVDSIDVSADDSGTAPGRPLVEIRVKNERGQYGRVVLTPAGEVLKVWEVR
ncbi:DUF1707 domain-containing protein [Nocardia sp. NPDC050713]|uniref:DUF1707 SHOCT-like domain-containing protein n=1 Tax=Nocardia sp. NPDC050713 TaxID=3154511 RepID=UPI0033F5533F